jgi:hypothetical protein
MLIEVRWPVFGRVLILIPESFWMFRIRLLVRSRAIEWSRLRLVFIHVPKCGGTSVNHALRAFGSFELRKLKTLYKYLLNNPYGPEIVSVVHWDSDFLIRSGLVPAELLEKVDSFATVRHPDSRMPSALGHLKRRGTVSTDIGIEEFVSTICAGSWEPRFRTTWGLSHAMPAQLWLKPKLWPGPKQLFQYDDMRAIEAYLARKLERVVTLEHRNQRPLGEDSPQVTSPHPPLCDKFLWDRETVRNLGSPGSS